MWICLVLAIIAHNCAKDMVRTELHLLSDRIAVLSLHILDVLVASAVLVTGSL